VANMKVAEDDAHEQTADIHALYDAANDLPSDDPLRDPSQIAPPKPSQPSAPPTSAALSAAPVPQSASAPPQSTQQTVTQTVNLTDGKTLRVPSLIGLPVRKVIEQAAAAGLDVQITGSGVVREQAPAPGTMVAPGTKIVVRCGR